MCGIAGIISPDHRHQIQKMTHTLYHRGPDEEGYFHDDIISLGQRRLSIIDLSNGKQPISNEKGNLQLICNGEIYNSPQLRKQLLQSGHSFKTATDVEVILHLYEEKGKDCVKELQGMFALAIWDADRRILFMARDHMGQKPLFFFNENGTFAFASEVKGILASGVVEPKINLDGLWHYISLRFVADQHSFFKKIQKLPAASSLTYEGGKLTIEKYWELDFSEKISGSEEDIAEQLDAMLRKTVDAHLLSDVRVGAFLSGGIDSSTIAALMATLSGEKVPTFSIGVKEQGFNELPYARMVVESYGMEGYERIVEADLIHLIPSMIHHMDEPSDPFGVGVYLVAREASREVKVVLGGDGGDENFAGYDRFAGNRLVDFYCLLPRWFRRHIMSKLIDRIPESFGYKSLAQKANWVNYMSMYEGGERYAQSVSFLRFTQQAKDQLFTESARKQIDDLDSTAKILRYFNSENVNDLVDRMLYTDLMTRMPDHLLVIVDRMCMAHSLESRSPLIDYKLVEFAAAIPARLKMNGKDLKYILRKVARRYLPEALIDRPKQGFGFPLGIWMRTDLKVFLRNLFRQSRFVEDGIFEERYMTELLNEHLMGKRDHNYRLWLLLNLELWYRLYFENQTLNQLQETIVQLSRN